MSEDAPRNLFQKLNAIMAEVGKIEKTGRNQSQNYNFIEQSVVMAKLRPMFAEAGVVVIPSITRTTYREIVSAKTGSVTTVAQCDMAFTLINADDPTDRMDNIAWSAEGGDTGDKAVNKAGTSGEKYFLMKLLMLSEKDDPDAETVSGGAATRQRTAAPVRPVRPTAPPARTEATPAGGTPTPAAAASSFAAQAAEGIADAHAESVAALKEQVRAAAREDGYTLEKWSDWRQLGARLDVGDPGADPATLTTGWCGLVLNRLKASAVR